MYDLSHIPESSHVGCERCAVANGTYLYEVIRSYLPDLKKSRFQFHLTLDALEEVTNDLANHLCA